MFWSSLVETYSFITASPCPAIVMRKPAEATIARSTYRSGEPMNALKMLGGPWLLSTLSTSTAMGQGSASAITEPRSVNRIVRM